MKNVKLCRCLIALLILSLTPAAWSDETAPAPDPMAAPADAAPPATTDVSNEGVPPAPVADPGMGSPEEAPAETPAEKPMKKKKKKAAKKAAKKKAGKHAKKKAKKAGKHAKKKKKHNNY